MKKKNLKSVDGYVFALLIIYFQETHSEVDSKEADAQPPWLEYWKDSTLKVWPTKLEAGRQQECKRK
ncbi:hypothetical protein PIB30_036666 [Stylosanthes scabra]|uniref:Uncharacterized protein n=1 Tax=Stylosanthes scabra TaxID=79078 RepID=A0ABU6WFI7_9FABA|nr:hypothetical protein [Stylosanthes scabra]